MPLTLCKIFFTVCKVCVNGGLAETMCGLDNNSFESVKSLVITGLQEIAIL